MEVQPNLKTKMGKRELENARRIGGISFIAPEDGSAYGSGHAVQKEDKKPDMLAGNCSEAWCTQQGSTNEVRLYSGMS